MSTAELTARRDSTFDIAAWSARRSATRSLDNLHKSCASSADAGTGDSSVMSPAVMHAKLVHTH